MSHDTSIVPTPQYKTCTKCGQSKSLNDEYHKPNKKTGKIHSWCRDCQAIACRERYAERRKNPPIRLPVDPNATKTCPKCGECKSLSAFSKQSDRPDGHAYICKPCDNERRKQNYRENHDRELAYRRKYTAENRDKVREYYFNNLHLRAAWRDKNREKIREQSRVYRRSHPETFRASKLKRRALEMSINGAHSADDIRALIAGQTDKRGVLRCWHCGKPCADKYHIDHFVPLAKGGTNDAGNLRISCPLCNQRKAAKMPAEFNGRLL